MITFDPTKCVGCGSCVRVCPMGYLGMEDRIPAPRERRRCIQCGHCVATCPTKALHFGPIEEMEALAAEKGGARLEGETMPATFIAYQA